jgi:hypothetical protein
MSIVPSGTIDITNNNDDLILNVNSNDELSEETVVETALFDYSSVNDINTEDIMSDCEDE